MNKQDGFYIFLKGDKDRLSDNFSTMEFTCQCNYEDCTEQKISSDLIDKLQELRDFINVGIEITSGYRCSKHQKDLKESGIQTASGISSHEMGIAADIRSPSLRIEELFKIMDSKWNNLGVAKTFIHCDLRPLSSSGIKRRWVYN